MGSIYFFYSSIYIYILSDGLQHTEDYITIL